LIKRALQRLELLSRFSKFPLRGQALIVREIVRGFGDQRVDVGACGG